MRISLSHFSENLNHFTLPEIIYFNALSGALCLSYWQEVLLESGPINPASLGRIVGDVIRAAEILEEVMAGETWRAPEYNQRARVT